LKKNPTQKRAGGVGPEFKPQYCKRKKEKKREKGKTLPPDL
jgi:hypothetical protein